jgi:hypothetical protein
MELDKLSTERRARDEYADSMVVDTRPQESEMPCGAEKPDAAPLEALRR